ncbi:MAG: hypothetical protein EOS03_08580 [Mesorhizobium sp.]|uniref:hypothetical protein n=1 Tax=Mesorhizobium sp. TaxID=1871066 RepID=UPI000FE5486D|nr:hypothetical protein [Mesorhizobium sp.]RWN47564.1 MAG: hypothetical protein EOS03_08580 [Mesorhizobium sp.]
MDKERAKDLLMNLLERATSGERTFLTSREVEALKLLLLEAEQSSTGTAPVVHSFGSRTSKTATPKVYKLALDLGTVQNEDANSIVCLDFGTSFSKAFATLTKAGSIRHVELPIGDGSSGSRLTTPSELLIADGKIFFGSKARQYIEDTQMSTEAIIDSIKQFITLGKEVSKLSAARLPAIQDKNSSLTQRDVLVLYLAHLMHLTETALAGAGLPKNLLRRFAHPAWKDQSKDENAREMRRLMAEAIVLARSVGADLADAVELTSALTLLEQLKTLSEELLPVALIGEPVREATAAGAGALLSTPENTRQAYLIIDVGAGTTDVAGFICVNNPDWDKARVFEISTASTAMNKAGNMLDQILHKHILDKSSLTQDTTEYRSASLDIRRQRRALKEQLFAEGRLLVLLPTDEAVEVELATFLNLPQMRDFSKTLHDLVAQSAAVVAGPASRIKLVATGGGSRLPFVTKLAEDGVQFEQRHIHFDLVEAMPSALAETNPELSEAFPQVAVAFGGSLPELPEQRSSVPTGIEDAPKRFIAPMYKS